MQDKEAVQQLVDALQEARSAVERFATEEARGNARSAMRPEHRMWRWKERLARVDAALAAGRKLLGSEEAGSAGTAGPDRSQDGYRGLQTIGETLVRIRWMEGDGGDVEVTGWFWQVGRDFHGPFTSSEEALGGATRALGGQAE